MSLHLTMGSTEQCSMEILYKNNSKICRLYNDNFIRYKVNLGIFTADSLCRYF